MFYAFTAANSETLYGWTCSGDVLSAMLNRLNRGREGSPYLAFERGNTDEATDLNGQLLINRDDLIINDDTTTEDMNGDAE